MKKYPLYEHPEFGTIRDLLYLCDTMYGEKNCFTYIRGKEEQKVTYTGFRKQVERAGAWLYDRGYENCHIALFGENSYAWILAYFAIVSTGNVVVPIDRELEPEKVLELLKDSGCKALLYSETYADVIEKLYDKNAGKASESQAGEASESQAGGASESQVSGIKCIAMKELEAAECTGAGMQRFLNAAVGRDTLATIVYTSGTTGVSKGVMLTHWNLCSDTCAACRHVTFHDRSILLLPLHHTFGLVAGLFAGMLSQCTLDINTSLRRLSADFGRCRPQNLFVVPLIVETLYKTIWTTAKKQGKDKLLRRLMKISDVLRTCGIDVRRKLFRSVLSAFGGKLEVITSGGAPLAETYVRGFESLGITVLNGYGITECGPVVAVNRNRYNIVGSVGIPLPCNEVKIAPDGEILVKGDNVMQGYYHMEEENGKVFEDGWFKTGDMGRIGENGELYITGRKKNLIILANGENIPAEVIEQEIYGISYVKEVLVRGENGMIVAEVYLDEEVPDAKERIYEDIRRLNLRLPQIKNIGKVTVRDTEFPKTTTKKIKRT